MLYEKIWKALISFEFKPKDWGPIQAEQYWRLFGFFRRIGIEIEAKYRLEKDVAKLLYDNGFRLSWVNHSECEITYLYDVSDPKKFIQQIQKTHDLLTELKFPTTGGIHLNFQHTKKSNRNSQLDKRFSAILPLGDNDKNLELDISTIYGIEQKAQCTRYDCRKFYRSEFKHGTGYVSPRDLVIEMFALALMKRSYNIGRAIKIKASMEEAVQKFYPKKEVYLQVSHTDFFNHIMRRMSYLDYDNSYTRYKRQKQDVIRQGIEY